MRLGFTPCSESFAFEPTVQVRSIPSQTGLHFVPSVRKSASCSFAFNGTHLPFPLTKTIHWIVFVRQSALCSLARLGLFGYPAPYFALKFYQTSTAQSEHWMLRVPLRSTLPKIRLLDLLHARGVSPTSYRSVGSTRSQSGLSSVRKSASCSFAFNRTSDFLFTSFACSKESSSALSSLALRAAGVAAVQTDKAAFCHLYRIAAFRTGYCLNFA